jgi:solute carrier family 9B (sodium/hydrogen exchanger), member 1/2
MKDFEEIIQKKGLPHVGETVRSKKHGSLWRVMEKKEVWHNIDPDPKTGEPRMVPAIYLMYWRIQPGEPPGVGKMMGFEYTLYDNTFSLNWDIVN